MSWIAARLFAVTACVACGASAWGESLAPETAAEIRTEDVTRFYDLYDRTNGRPSVAELQRSYLEPGTEGLQHLTRVRNVSAEKIARALAEQPELYARARVCLSALPRRLLGRLPHREGVLLEVGRVGEP